jgi:hypothetical protein
MGGDPWQQKKNIGLRFRCHAQITFKGGGTDDRIIGRDPTSTNGSHFLVRELSEDRHALIPVAVSIIIVPPIFTRVTIVSLCSNPARDMANRSAKLRATFDAESA